MSVNPKPLQDITYPVLRTGLSEHRIWAMCRKGYFPHVRFGRRIKFDPDQIEAWINNGGAALPEAERRK